MERVKREVVEMTAEVTGGEAEMVKVTVEILVVKVEVMEARCGGGRRDSEGDIDMEVAGEIGKVT